MDKLFDKVKLIGTHDQVFHADDVFAIAALQQIFPKAKIVRTRDKRQLAKCDLLVDVGGEYDHQRLRYDHHQNDFCEAHSNGILRSGFGLVWLHFGDILTNSKYATSHIDDTLVATIDALDNGQALSRDVGYGAITHTITDFIENHNPIGHDMSLDDYDMAFFRTVELASDYLTLLIAKYKNREVDSNIFLELYERSLDRRILVLDTALDCPDVELELADLLYVIYPRPDGAWNIKATALDAAHKFDNKLPLPKSWRGLRSDELARVCGVKTAQFCHRTGFLAVTSTRQDAILLAQKSISLDRSIT